MQLTVIITGTDENSVEDALDEVRRLLKEGFTSGADGNEFSRFRFALSDERDD